MTNIYVIIIFILASAFIILLYKYIELKKEDAYQYKQIQETREMYLKTAKDKLELLKEKHQK